MNVLKEKAFYTQRLMFNLLSQMLKLQVLKHLEQLKDLNLKKQILFLESDR